MNPMIETSTDCAGIEWQQVQELFMDVGWGKRELPDIERAFAKSSHKVFAFAGEKLVGFGRTTDDGINYAMICDLVVAPAFQGMGIGSQILNELRDMCENFRFLTLTAAEGKDGFYLKQGWQRQLSSFILPRDEKQARIHAKPTPISNPQSDGHSE